MNKDNIATWILGGLFTVLSVIGGFIINRFDKQNEILNEQNDAINKIYIRERGLDQRLDDEGMYRTVSAKTDSNTVDIRIIKHKLNIK